ncbi:winged helix-turn-helix transcriptional regulator [Kineosporia sp. J2-2]|uniref:Winged helix-turn-helix transcriptional regulator n=1 Tax=Kineosporia corallincola TaxID=2835133 RepID=A0ABS5TBB6_9ACTN|nr:winged helix-turn-helix domain-containing protein [Kineosporia corallincola]MBT0768362.1 winged helix-turn-helix transcriptional regulator [Kineosporia corallincola]
MEFGIRVDDEARQVHGPHGTAALTAKECDLLLALMRSHGAVVTRHHLLTQVWNLPAGRPRGTARSLDVHIATLRAKLGASSGTGPGSARIDTVRGTGYRLVPAALEPRHS